MRSKQVGFLFDYALGIRLIGDGEMRWSASQQSVAVLINEIVAKFVPLVGANCFL